MVLLLLTAVEAAVTLQITSPRKIRRNTSTWRRDIRLLRAVRREITKITHSGITRRPTA